MKARHRRKREAKNKKKRQQGNSSYYDELYNTERHFCPISRIDRMAYETAFGNFYRRSV